jgi:hypothetical protein
VSTEFQLAFPCPHFTLEEPVVLGEDRRTLSTRQPVGASGSVRVQVTSASDVRRLRPADPFTVAEESFYIPPSGLLSFASVEGAVSSPFAIIKNFETVTVRSSEETVTVHLPAGPQVTAQQVIDAIQPQVTSILVENVNGHLVFSDISKVGQPSRIRVTGDGAPSIGFEFQQGARGAVVFPAWRLEKRDDTIANRYPKFVSPVKQAANFKVTYTVPVERCLRCGATFVENDYRFNIQGEPLVIENEDLLYQAALKILLTGKGSNPFHPFYGTHPKSRIGTKAVGAITTLINEDVRLGLRNFQRLQQEQAKFQQVSPKERLFQILSVNVSQHEQDPSAFLVDVTVSNASGEPISLSVVFTVPGAIALAGSNGQSLGLDTTGLTNAQSQLFFG